MNLVDLISPTVDITWLISFVSSTIDLISQTVDFTFLTLNFTSLMVEITSPTVELTSSTKALIPITIDITIPAVGLNSNFSDVKTSFLSQ